MSSWTIFIAVALLSSPAGDPGQGVPSDEDKDRYGRLVTLLNCACKSENWTRTLEGCPDGCADPQKKEIRDLIGEGKSDEEILAFMEGNYGPKVIATTPFSGIHVVVYLAPVLLLAGGAALILSYLRRRTSGPGPTGESPATDAEDEVLRQKLDRELEEMS